MNLVTSYFLVRRLPGSIALGSSVEGPVQQARQLEYIDCLRRNRQHPDVASIHLLVEGLDAYNHLRRHILRGEHDLIASKSLSMASPTLLRRETRRAPIIPVLHSSAESMTYADLFAHANQLLAHRLTMVCNADIYLSPTSFRLAAVADLFRQASAISSSTEHRLECPPPCALGRREERTEVKGGRSPQNVKPPLALALTRFESDNRLDAPLVYDYRGSHDAFVFLSPLPNDFVRSVAHAQNSYKAENLVIHELQRHGYLTLNPALSDELRVVHHHVADVRQWYPPTDESRYSRAPPCTLAEAAAHIKEASW